MLNAATALSILRKLSMLRHDRAAERRRAQEVVLQEAAPRRRNHCCSAREFHLTQTYHFRAVAVISIRDGPISFAIPTIVRVGRGSLKYVR